MKVKMILPALTEAHSPLFRPIKYALFPPLGLMTLAGWLSLDDDVEIVDEHVQDPSTDSDDRPDLVVIQVYITNARRAYEIAAVYRARGAHVALGGLHVTSLPDEAARHADTIFSGPGEDTFPLFLREFRQGRAKDRYVSTERTLEGMPAPRRDLVDSGRYLAPSSLVVSRGCPHHCAFCYKDAFFRGGRSFYLAGVDRALAEIEGLPGRHLYFLDDHLLGSQRFASELFAGMEGMGRVFQGAATVDSVLKGDLIEKAARAGLRSLFIGFETLSMGNLREAGKLHSLGRNYNAAIKRLHDLGILINGSFVFGLDGDDPDVFKRTVDWATSQGITTATFHILTPYPGTPLFTRMQREGRIISTDWERYDTRHTVFKPQRMTPGELERGYQQAYRDFYRWGAIFKGAVAHSSIANAARHLALAGAWKKLEPMWDLVIRAGQLQRMRPVLERVLAAGRGWTGSGRLDDRRGQVRRSRELNTVQAVEEEVA